MELSKNCLLQWHREGSDWNERVLLVDVESGDAFVVRLDPNHKTKCGWPLRRTAKELEAEFKEGHFHVLSPEHDPYLRPIVNRDSLPKEQQDKWDKICKAILLIAQNPGVWVSGNRKKTRGLIKAAVKVCGLHRSRIYPYLFKYWAGGQTPQCLLPDEGNHGKKRAFKGGKKRGRKSAAEREAKQSIGISVTPEIEKLLLQGIQEFYEKDPANSLDDAYTLALARYFNVGWRIEDGIEVPVLKPDEELPTFRQFEYVYEKHKDPIKEGKGRKGENNFDLTGRRITGHSETLVMGPGLVGQVDWTTADIYLRSDDDPHLIVGRPVIYAMVDVWGKFLYSLITTFERPGFWSGVMALENALVDKVEYCAQYGVTIEQDEWPVNFLPEELVVDGGEFSGYKTDHLITALGMRISTLPPRRGDLKGLVERFFGRVKGQMIRWLPGAMPHVRGQDEQADPLDSKLTVSEFRRLLIEAVRRYHRKELKRYHATGDLMAAGIPFTPIELLKWGSKFRGGRKVRFPLDQARLHLLPGGEATVTPEGVRFGKLFYTCDRAVTEGWYERARRFGDYKILVAYDPRCAARIFLRGPKTTILEPLFLTESYVGFQNSTWTGVEAYFKRQAAEAEARRHQELQDKVRAMAAAQQISKLAEKRQKAIAKTQPEESKAAQTRAIKGNQAEFRENEKVKSAQGGAAPATPPPVETPPTNVIPLPPQPPAPAAPPAPPPSLSIAKLKLLEKIKSQKGTT